MNVRHVVVVRKDLLMSPGLLAVQVAHISDQFMREKLAGPTSKNKGKFSATELVWMRQPYITVLAVNTLEELSIVADRGTRVCLPVFKWYDVMPTLASAEKVLVGISIGPEDSDKLKAVTNDLPLF